VKFISDIIAKVPCLLLGAENVWVNNGWERNECHSSL